MAFLAGAAAAAFFIRIAMLICLFVVPGPDSENETDKIRLLSSPDFFEVFVCSHN